MTTYQHYVYAYLREDGSPYYIGKGKGDRAFKKHRIATPTDRSRIVFLETNLSDIGSLALERRYIRWYGRKDLGTGILRNLTDGGEGASGTSVSEKTREKMSFAVKNRSEETLKKIGAAISKAKTGKKRKPFTDQCKANMSASRKNISKETREKLSFAAKNISDETKAKKVAAFHTPEARAKAAKKNKGRRISEETRAKISEKAKQQWSEWRAKKVSLEALDVS